MSTYERERAILDNYGLVIQVAKRFGRLDLDVIQEGVLGLIRAVDGYQPGVHAFSIYACVAIRRAIIHALRKESAGRRREVSRDDVDLLDAASELPFEEARFRIDAREVAGKLKGRSRCFFERLVGLDGSPAGSYKNVAEEFGAAPSTVTRRIGGLAEALILEGAER